MLSQFHYFQDYCFHEFCSHDRNRSKTDTLRLIDSYGLVKILSRLLNYDQELEWLLCLLESDLNAREGGQGLLFAVRPNLIQRQNLTKWLF